MKFNTPEDREFVLNGLCTMLELALRVPSDKQLIANCLDKDLGPMVEDIISGLSQQENPSVHKKVWLDYLANYQHKNVGYDRAFCYQALAKIVENEFLKQDKKS